MRKSLAWVNLLRKAKSLTLIWNWLSFNPLPDDKFLTLPNWKSLHTTISNLTKMAKAIQMGRKHCGKRRNCLLRAFSPFPTVFSKGLFPRGVKRCHCVWKGLNIEIFCYRLETVLHAPSKYRIRVWSHLGLLDKQGLGCLWRSFSLSFSYFSQRYGGVIVNITATLQVRGQVFQLHAGSAKAAIGNRF